MNNIVELRKELSKLFMDVRSGAVDIKRASEMNNSAGKIIHSLKVELEHCSLVNEKPSIAFLDGSKE